jgi:DNA-binding NarL/FixJ family response regulator
VLVLSQCVELTCAAELLAGASAGAGVGYLLKDGVSRFEDFADAIERVAAGDAMVDPVVGSQPPAGRGASDPAAALSPRESGMLALMAQGRTNAAIAQRLVSQLGRRWLSLSKPALSAGG